MSELYLSLSFVLSFSVPTLAIIPPCSKIYLIGYRFRYACQERCFPFSGATAFSSSSLQPVAAGTRCSLRNLIPGTAIPTPGDATRGTIYNDIEPTRIFRYSYSGRKVSAIIRVINEGTTAFSGIIATPERNVVEYSVSFE